MQKLEVINAMLASVGQLPATSIESQHPDVLTAVSKFNVVNRQVQNKGYWFNTDYNVSLVPNPNGEIVLPETALSVDPQERTRPYLQRGGKLYDPYTSSTKFTSPVVCRIVSLVEFSDLPSQAAMYILHRCVYEYFLDFDGEQVKTTFFNNLAAQAYEELNTEELKVMRHSLVDNPQWQRMQMRVRRRTFPRRY